MPSSSIVHPRDERRTRTREALLNVSVGLVFIVVGLGLTVLPLWAIFRISPGWYDGLPMLLPAVLSTSFIWVVGLSMLIQGLRRRPGVDGFAYRLLSWLAARASPATLWVAAAMYCLVGELWGRVSGSPTRATWWTALAILALALLQLLLHELAHWAVATELGLTPFRLTAGPLSVERAARTWTLTGNRRWSFLLGGLVEFDATRAPSRSLALVAVAGPGATLGLLGLGSLLASVLDHPSPFVSELLEANQTMAIGALVINLYPAQFGSFATDGFQILNYLRNR